MTHFIVILTVLGWSETEPIKSLRYTIFQMFNGGYEEERDSFNRRSSLDFPMIME